MDQEEQATPNKRRKTEEDAIAQDSILQHVDDNTDDKSVCSSVVDLIDDAWLLVFSYLDIVDRARIARVCRRWKELSRISWRSITMLYLSGFSSSPYCVLRQICGPRLRCHINFIPGPSPRYLTPRALDPIGLYGTSLQELSLNGMALDNTALKTLAERLPRLRYLSLCYSKYIGEEEVLRTALKMPQSLKSLDVASNEWITDEILSQAPRSLETIGLDDCRSLTAQSITDIVQNYPKLKRFWFCNMNMSNLLTSHLLTLSSLPLLEELSLDNQPDAVTDQVFYELGRHCPLLRLISGWECHQLTDAAISNLSPCRHLETIDLRTCPQITDRGLIQLSSAHPQLKEVNMADCQGITDDGVGHLLLDHPNLLELVIRRCPLVTDRVVPKLRSSLQRRQHTQPLKIWVRNTSISSEKVDELKGNSKVNIIH